MPVVHFYTSLLPALLDPGALICERQGKLLWLNRVYIDATPSTGLIGSAPDVARLMLAYLQRGTPDGNPILLPESVSLPTETAPIEGHGLGWFSELLKLSSSSKQVVADKSEHFIQLQQPQLVVDAIDDVLSVTRK